MAEAWPVKGAAKASVQPAYEYCADGMIRLVEGVGYRGDSSPLPLGELLGMLGIRHPLVVSGRHFGQYRASAELQKLGFANCVFSDFTSNPRYEEAMAAARAFLDEGCDALVSVGGGTAIDIAKCVKALVTNMEGPLQGALAPDPVYDGPVPHVAMPTTAGTGSESTRFAVLYINGEKHSIANMRLLPDASVLDPVALRTLSDYQKKATMLDALCQAIESWWSKRSCAESQSYSARAIASVMANVDAYLSGDDEAARAMMVAANLAGRAIDITTTTAAHAMSYKLTSQFGIAHGHAVALCMPPVWRLLIERADDVVRERLSSIAKVLCGDESADESAALDAFCNLMVALDMPVFRISGFDPLTLAASVNVQRMSNHPLEMTQDDIAGLYESVYHSIVSA